MDLQKAVQYALNDEAILFAGAGFPYKATNISNEEFKAGDSLKKGLIKELEIDDDQSNLEDVAQYYIGEKSPEALIEHLKEKFTVKSVQPYHENVMSINWKGIYTTNYDRVIELSAEKNGKYLTPVTYSTSFEDTYKKDFCVHINGYIDKLDQNTLFNEFKLIERSYSCDSLVGDPWFEYMVSDFKTANAIIVVGYSLQYDIDIKRIFALPEIRDKIIFIVGPMKTIERSRLEEYGPCLEIGIQGLSEAIEKERLDFKKSERNDFYSFRYENEHAIIPLDITYKELTEAYCSGNISDRLFKRKPSGEYEYLVERWGINSIISNLYRKAVYLITSDLGNGKTIFCKMLINELLTKDVHIFTFTSRRNNWQDEVERIVELKRSGKKVIVIIDDYPWYFDILRQFYYVGNKNITFILTARSSMNQINSKKLCQTLNIDVADIKPIYLNIMNTNEIDNFAQVIYDNKLLTNELKGMDLVEISDYLKNKCDSKMANILLKVFDSSYIKNELSNIYSEAIESMNQNIKEICIFSLLQPIMNIKLTFSELLELLSADYITLLARENTFITEIFDIKENEWKLKSSIIAKSLLTSTIKFNEIIDVLIKIMKLADERATRDVKNSFGRTLYELQINLVSHSHFVSILHTEDTKEIARYYDEIRNTNFAKDNPFFWEQFASAYIDMKDYSMCKRCLDVAFDAAEKLEKQLGKFIPVQVETVYGRYIIEKLLSDMAKVTVTEEESIEKLIECHTHLMKYYYDPSNNAYYTFKIAHNYIMVYNQLSTRYNDRQKSIFMQKMQEVISKMEEFLETEKESIHLTTIGKWIGEMKQCFDKCRATLKKTK